MSEQTVKFTIDEVNKILEALGEIPAKYSLDLVYFIRNTAQTQLQAAAPEQPEVTDAEVVKE